MTQENLLLGDLISQEGECENRLPQKSGAITCMLLQL